MAKLTDTQLIVLSKAAQRDDGAAVAPARMNEVAVAKVAASLVARGLMREVRAKTGMPVWRTDEDGRRIGLIIMKAGRDAIGAEPSGQAAVDISDLRKLTCQCHFAVYGGDALRLPRACP